MSRRTKNKKKKDKRDQLSSDAMQEDVVNQEAGDLDLAQETIELSEEAAELVRILEAERDEAVEGRKRALADYSNFQKRSRENEGFARKDGAHSVLRSLLPVLDHFDLALTQDMENITVEQLLGGVKMVHTELVKALDTQGVSTIEPQAGDAFDPMQHQAMLRQPAEGIEPNHIVATLQAGYKAGEYVLRPAKVSVAPEPPESPETTETIEEEPSDNIETDDE